MTHGQMVGYENLLVNAVNTVRAYGDRIRTGAVSSVDIREHRRAVARVRRYVDKVAAGFAERREAQGLLARPRGEGGR